MIENAHLARWKLIKASGIPWVRDNAIPTYFREHAEVGSPLGPEMPIDGGGVVQAFTGCVLKWTPEGGVEVVTD